MVNVFSYVLEEGFEKFKLLTTAEERWISFEKDL